MGEGGAVICSLAQSHCHGVSLRKYCKHLMTTVRLQCKNKNEASQKQCAMRLTSRPCRSLGRVHRWGEAAGGNPRFTDSLCGRERWAEIKRQHVFLCSKDPTSPRNGRSLSQTESGLSQVRLHLCVGMFGRLSTLFHI